MKTAAVSIVFRNFWMENVRRGVACNVSLTMEIESGKRWCVDHGLVPGSQRRHVGVAIET